jgi:phytoene desaturase
MAPPGADALSFLLPVRDLRAGFDWERDADELRAAFVGDLERSFGLAGLGAAVAVEHRMTPPDFVREFGAVDANAFSLEPTLLQSPSLRPAHRVPGVAGMYRVGAGTHPGAGIPGVLIGAATTAQLVLDDARRRRRPGT